MNALDRATDGNGAGKLIIDFYVNKCFWTSFSESQRWQMERAIRRFRRELVQAGFLSDTKDGEEVDRGV